MRMWMTNPTLLCDQHLLGEHSELHLLAWNIDAGHSLDGYLREEIVNPGRIGERHDELAAELTRRGMNHDSPLDQPDVSDYPAGYVNRITAHRDLAERCPECAYRLANNATARVVMA